jgi:RNA polymerase sigma-70 factor, ECF subfamily
METNEMTLTTSLVAQCLAAGRAAWPGLTITADDLASQLGRHDDVAASTSGIAVPEHAADMYLACACAAGERAAIRVFEERFLNPTLTYLRARRSVGPAAEQELRQVILTRLFVREQGGTPRIASYRGQAPLLGWLRTVASRAAVDLARQQHPDGFASEAEVGDLRSQSPDPELDYLKRLYRSELGRAFADTLAALPPREASFLRLHYLDGLTMESIASTLRISRRTVHRCITRSRREILQKTRALLSQRLDISQSEFDTIMDLVRSQLELEPLGLFTGPRDQEESPDRGPG